MKLLVFSDIHGDAVALSRLMETPADFYIVAGDLANWARGLEKLGPLLQAKADLVYVLPGNHEHASHTAAFCEQFGLHHLHGRSIELNGWKVAGLGHSNPTPFDTPGESSEQELAAALEPFHPLDPLILVCHCPPLNTALDEAAPGRHFGSSAIARFIEEKQPAWFFCGHIHEAAGRKVELGRTTAVNVGKQGFLLEVPDLASEPSV